MTHPRVLIFRATWAERAERALQAGSDAPASPATRHLWTMTCRDEALAARIMLPCIEQVAARVTAAGEVLVSHNAMGWGRVSLGGHPLRGRDVRVWSVGEVLEVSAPELSEGGVFVFVREDDAGDAARGPTVEVELGPEPEGAAWCAQAIARVRLGALRDDAFVRRLMLACLNNPARGLLRALRREASGSEHGWHVPYDTGAELLSAPDVTERWVDAWLADRRALAVGGEPPGLLLGCSVKAWLLDRSAPAPQPVFPLHNRSWITLSAEGLCVEPAVDQHVPPHTLEWRWERERREGVITARWWRWGDQIRPHDGDAITLRDELNQPREVRFRTGEAVVVRGWGPGGARVSVAFDGPEMTLGGGDAEVTLADVSDASCVIRHSAPASAGLHEAPMSAGRFEVEVSGEAPITREVRVMRWAGQRRDVWAVGAWRFTLERWPQEEQSDDSAMLGANAALALLRELVMRDEATEAAWSDVMWQAGVCRATGVGDVAGDYLDAYLARWPERFAAPRCPCRRWSRWAEHHIPSEPDARRAMLKRCAGFTQGQPCLSRFSLHPGDADVEDTGAEAPLVLACASWLGVDPEQGKLWAARGLEDARGEVQWRYRWSPDAGEGVLSRVEGARDVLECDGQAVEHITLRSGQRLVLGERVWEVRRGVWPLRVRVEEKGGRLCTMTFAQAAVGVGRVRGNDIVLPKGNVSKRQCRFVYRDGAWIAVDLRSCAGTYINGRKISGPQVLHSGDRVYVGDFILTFPDLL